LEQTKFHLICERDVGLFSLIQSVVAHVPWALAEGRTPIAFFRDRCSYFTPAGYHQADTVWEYYFEPVIESAPVSAIPDEVRELVSGSPPEPTEPGYWASGDAFVSAHFGNHPSLKGKTLWIPYWWDDPDQRLRAQASVLIEKYVRPRPYIQEKIAAFYDENLKGHYCVGLHVRGTDAISKKQLWGSRRLGSLHMDKYVAAVEGALNEHPEAKVFVATDDQSSLDALAAKFPSHVVAYDSIRHTGGEAAGAGPTGWIMPTYITEDRDKAAKNGEEAVIEYLLLSKCDLLVHNGSALARTALLTAPNLRHINTHPPSLGNRLRSYLAMVNTHQLKRVFNGIARRLRLRPSTSQV